MTEESPTAESQKSGFSALLEKVKACPPADASAQLPEWRRMLDEIWPSDTTSPECWKLLVKELPIPNGVGKSPSPKDLCDLLSRNPNEYRSMDVFLCACGLPRLGDRIWSQAGSEEQILFIAGCINLAILAKKNVLPGMDDSLLPKLSHHVSYYCEAIALSALEANDSTTVLKKVQQTWRLAEVIDLQPNRRFLKEEDLTKAFRKHEHVLDSPVLEFISCITRRDQESIKRSLLLGMAKDAETRERAQHFWWEDRELSRALAAMVTATSGEDEKKKLFSLWSHFLVPDDAFQFSWEVLFWVTHTWQNQETRPFGSAFDDRLRALRELLDAPSRAAFHSIMRDKSGERGWKQSTRWRNWFVEFFQALGSLMERDKWSRSYEEDWVRHSRAIELLAAEQALIPSVVRGILAKGKEHWSVLDPIILGLPAEPTIACLEQYAADHSAATEDHFHAKLLIAHLRGDSPIADSTREPTGLLGAVETLIEVSRSKLPDSRIRTWLGDVALEGLWLGATQKAVKEFNAYLETEYGHDEHDHVSVFADGLARNLNATNNTIRQWLKSKQSPPLFLNVAIRRLAKTAPDGFPQEGGREGLQADLGLLVNCNVPGMMKARRLTLLQAKKLKLAKPPHGWAGGFSFKGENYTQLKKLLAISQHAHYLFFIHPSLGVNPLLFPADTVLDSCDSSAARNIPLTVVRNGGMAAPEFLLHEIIGLWTGDQDRALLEKCNSAAQIYQGPRVMVDIQISAENVH
jgi:hypothetical protein